MRIYNEDSDKSIDRITIYLTKAEANEFKDSLEDILKKPLDNHSHITGEEVNKEITVCIYDVDNLKGFDKRSIDLILNDE